jgi:hypothetical protein
MSTPRNQVAAANPTSVAAPRRADDDVLAADADAAQHLPDEPDDGQLFTGFGIGDLDAMCISSLSDNGYG